MRIILLLFVFLAVMPVLGFDDPWAPITPKELDMKQGIVDPESPAEAIFWHTEIIGGAPIGNKTRYYIRIKLFSDLGIDEFGKVSIEKPRYGKIKNLKARITYPDGTSKEINKNDVFESTIAKSYWVKQKQLSFVYPNAVPGSIVEYSYLEDEPNNFFFFWRYDLQKGLPIQTFRMRFDPNYSLPYAIVLHNTSSTFADEIKKGEREFEVKNIPKKVEEPFMPPSSGTNWWMDLEFNETKAARKRTALQNWNQIAVVNIRSFRLADVYESAHHLRLDAEKIVGEVESDDKRVERLFNFCRSEIFNIVDDDSQTRQERFNEIRKIRGTDASKSARKTLKDKRGLSVGINELFASLVQSLGIETRYVFTGDNRTGGISVASNDLQSVTFIGIAVRLDNAWHYFDPANLDLEPGMIAWYRENQDAMLLNGSSLVWVKTPSSPPSRSAVNNSAEVTISPDNTLSGHAKIVYSGHLQNSVRNAISDLSEKDQQLYVAQIVQSTLPEAQITNAVVKNLKHIDGNLTFQYDLVVPNYAVFTKKRLVFEPNLFTKNTREMFPASDRESDVYFDFSWQENDSVVIKIPDGLELEANSNPASVNNAYFGVSNTVTTAEESGKLRYSRETNIGIGGKRRFSYGKYPELKDVFGKIHQMNTASLLFRRTDDGDDL